MQELKLLNLPKRHCFALWALENFQDDSALSSQILFRDVALFRLNGYVNSQNCFIWDEDQLEEIQELRFYPEKTAVWCGLWVGVIIGPYFLQNDVWRERNRQWRSLPRHDNRD